MAGYLGQGIQHCRRCVEWSPRPVGNVKPPRIVAELDLRGPGTVGDLLERFTGVLAGLEGLDEQDRLHARRLAPG
jgi:hypothetical protein